MELKQRRLLHAAGSLGLAIIFGLRLALDGGALWGVLTAITAIYGLYLLRKALTTDKSLMDVKQRRLLVVAVFLGLAVIFGLRFALDGRPLDIVLSGVMGVAGALRWLDKR